MTQSKGIYRASSRKGTGRTQKRIGMAVDADLMDWLEQQPNKTRYINGLIRQDMELTRLRETAAAMKMNLGELLTYQREERESQIQDADFEEP